MDTQKNIILVVGPASGSMFSWLEKYNSNKKKEFIFYNLLHKKNKKKKLERAHSLFETILFCDFNDPDSIREALLPYEKDILAATCRSEAKMEHFANTIPHIPYLRTPSSKSLRWSVDKISMRKRFKAYNKKITPKFVVVQDLKKDTISKIEKTLEYPLVVKPSGLSASLLVNKCYHTEELRDALKKIFRKVGIFNKKYKETYNSSTPTVLVEEFMEGELYSVDGVITSRGKVYCYPPVHVKTGKQIGFDDFFGYRRITPTKLSKESVEACEATIRDAIHALGLRSSAFHIELFKTESGWKVIEIGPRVGGFRQDMYELSYGIDAAMNDILIRIPKKPIIHKKVLAHSAVLQIFSKKEGIIKSIRGIKKVKELKSLVRLIQKNKIGDRVKFAKNGGKAILTITLANKERASLLADVRKLEQELKVIV